MPTPTSPEKKNEMLESSKSIPQEKPETHVDVFNVIKKMEEEVRLLKEDIRGYEIREVNNCAAYEVLKSQKYPHEKAESGKDELIKNLNQHRINLMEKCDTNANTIHTLQSQVQALTSERDEALEKVKRYEEALDKAQHALKQSLGAFEHNWAIDWNDLEIAIEVIQSAISAERKENK